MDPKRTSPRKVENRRSYFAMAAFGITWVASAWRVSPFASWAGDYAIVQGLFGAAVGAEGIPYASLAWIVRLLPIGTPVQRLSLVAAFGAAAAAWFAFQLAHEALDRDPLDSWTRCWLALGASLLASLGSTAQLAATTPNGATIAATAGLASLWLVVRFSRTNSDLREEASFAQRDGGGTALALGSAIAVTWLESHLVGLFVTAVALIVFLLRPSAYSRESKQCLCGGAGIVLLAVGLPWLVARRELAAAAIEHSAFDGFATLRPFSDHGLRLGQWVASLGPIWFTVALVGLVLVLLARERQRSIWILVVFGVGLVVSPVPLQSGQRGAGVVLILGTVLSLAATKGLRELIHWTTLRKPSAAALAATLAVVAQAVTVLARSEEAAFATDHYRSLGTEVWTDEALAALPARAIVLARTQPIVERVIAAQVGEALRPDVLLVPLEHATDPRLVSLLLSAEPALAAVLRDLAINGRPSENSMSGLADVRPLFVEFDGSWDPRLREHLLVQPFFHRVLSQTLGRSDRAAALPAGQRAVARLVEATADPRSSTDLTHGSSHGDFVTRSILDLRLREQLTLLLALGDRANFETIAGGYEAAFRGSSWMARVRHRIGATSRSSIDVFDLLYEPGSSPGSGPASQGAPSLSRRKG